MISYESCRRKLEELIAQYDSLNKKDFAEHSVSTELRKLKPADNEEISPELLSELMAFDFSEDYNDKNTGWGTYFGPMMVWNNEDGIATESPSIRLVTPEMIYYWEKRAKESINPVLIARYSGLVWDFQDRIIGQKPSHEICRIYINALIDIANGDFHKYKVNTFSKLKRALQLATRLNDKELIESCKQSILDFEKRHSIDNKPGLWGYAFDLLVGNKKVNLSDKEESEIIQELEAKLERLSRVDSNEQKIDPWAAEAAATRLATYYRKKQKNNDIQRVILEVGNAYDKIIDEASGMQASGWLDHLYKLYIKFNLKEEAAKTLLRLREIGPKTAGEFKSISHSFEIPREKIEAYVNEMTSGSLEDVLLRIATQYIPIKQQVKEQIFDLSKKAPLTYLIRHNIQDEKGRVIATIGPLENDLEGHIIRQVSQNISFSSIFLRQVISESIRKMKLGRDEIIRFIENTPIIQKPRFEIIKKGLDAYFSDDFLVSIHLLIPQIEDAIRNIVEYNGGNILKPSRSGGFHLKTFDEILRDEIIIKSLGEDFADYLRIIFTDQRGWNLRNNVCHGMSNPDMFNVQIADRVLHTIICLGLIHESKT